MSDASTLTRRHPEGPSPQVTTELMGLSRVQLMQDATLERPGTVHGERSSDRRPGGRSGLCAGTADAARAPVRVLVIDEERAVGQALARVLKGAGAQTVVLTNLWEFAALLDSQSFEVVIGEDLAIMLVKELAPASRRFLLTDSREEWTEAQLVALGVELVVEKPWDNDQLLRALGLVA